jgi:DNA-directed RNA polymerase specialized sigma24 family protein
VMTDGQFDALATLLRLQAGRSREAARLVLVGGLAPSAAAVATGVSAQAVSNAVRRCRAGLQLAKIAGG